MKMVADQALEDLRRILVRQAAPPGPPDPAIPDARPNRPRTGDAKAGLAKASSPRPPTLGSAEL